MQLILRTTAAASNKAANKKVCKLRARCLNPKEIWTMMAGCGLFGFPHARKSDKMAS
jgi:hypothetical protein